MAEEGAADPSGVPQVDRPGHGGHHVDHWPSAGTGRRRGRRQGVVPPRRQHPRVTGAKSGREPRARILANVHKEVGEVEDAETLLDEALRLAEQPFAGSDHPHTATVLLSLGALKNQVGDYVSGGECLHRALRVFRVVLSPRHETVGQVCLDIGASLKLQANMEKAGPWLERADRLLSTALGQ